MAFGRLARRVADDFVQLWDQAQAQQGGSYWKLTSDAERTLDFAATVERVMRQVRAFGPTESIAALDGYVGLIEWSPIPLVAIDAVGRSIPSAAHANHL
jgi:methionyl-tRNA formyltransferase